jgi:hypothetical protein
MALSSHLPPSETKKVIETRQKYLLKELDREMETLKAFDDASDKMTTAGRLMFSLTVEHFRAELKWLEKVWRELPEARSKVCF